MQLTCCIIGSSQLALQCSQILLKHCTILAIVTEDEIFAEWAKQHHIQCFVSDEDLLCLTFDYLFSIINEKILSSVIVNLPIKMAINYHDAPLPRYAGTHATSWAILNQETMHGITWHIMSTMVDAGDLLKQVYFPIAANDTALTLNAKCYQAAITSFTELIGELILNQCKITPQLLSKRTFFSKVQKPSANGLIAWTEPAEIIDSLYRACYFGDRDNQFATVKFLVNRQCMVIREASIVKNINSSYRPGEIIEVNDHAVIVMTAKNAIKINKVAYIDGHEISIPQFIQKFSLKVGYKLPIPNKELKIYVETLSKKLSIYENFWVQQFTHYQQYSLPYFTTNQNKTIMPYIKKKFKFPILPYSKTPAKYILISTLLIYLYRISEERHFSIGYSNDSLSNLPEQFFLTVLPFNISVTDDETFVTLCQQIVQRITLLEAHHSCLNDLSLRYPQLNKKAIVTDKFSVIFHVGSQRNWTKLKNNAQFIMSYDPTNSICTLQLNYYMQNEWLLNQIDGHIQQLINSITQNPNDILHQLPIITEREQNWLFKHRGNTILKQSWLEKSIPEIFDEIVKQYPDAVALTFRNISLTYRELNRKINLLVIHLQKQNIQYQANIAIYIPRSIEAIIAMLAILKVRAVYLPIAIDYPEFRITYMLNDANCSLIISTEQYHDKLLWLSKKIKVCNITPILHDNSFPLQKETYYSQPSDLAYILYTSGSTGKPKGVMINHRGIIRLVKCDKNFVVPAKQTLLHIATISFDIAMFEIWGGLLNGAKIIISPNTVPDPRWIKKTIQKERSRLIMASGMFTNIIHSIPDAFDNAETLYLGGESLPLDPIKTLLQRKKQFNLNITIVNVYGPTENSIASTCYIIDSVKDSQMSIPIGRPIAGTSAYVLNERQQFVPIGVPGELYLGGIGLSEGYLNKPQLNASAFIVNPYFEQRGDKLLYKTGDIAKWCADGNLDFIERRDFQIKLRGMRIELNEIEIQINKFSDVKKAIVLFDKKKQCLTAYLQVDSESKNNITKTKLITEIRHELANILPNFMIPNYFYILTTFPLTTNGKIDRLALLTLQQKHTKQHLPYSPIEQRLAQFYQTILSVKLPNIDDDFFQLGGNSLLAMQLIIKIEQIFHVSVPFHQLFNNTNIKQLAKLITKLLVNKIQKNNDIGKVRNLKKARLSFSQELIWLFEQLYPNTPTYNIPILIKLTGQLNQDALTKAFTTFIKRHIILQSHFEIQKGIPKQLVTKNYKFTIIKNTIDNIDGTLKDFINHQAKKPFNLLNSKELLIRVYLVSINNDEHQLLIVFHHLIADLASLDIFYQEISTLYNAYCQNILPNLPKLPFQYYDYCYWQRITFTDKIIQAHQHYWKMYLADAPSSTMLSTDYTSSNMQQYTGKTYIVKLAKDKLNLIQKMVLAHKSTFFMGLLTAFFIFLHHYIQQDDMIIGIPVSVRQHQKTINLMGMFVNLLPVRLKFNVLSTFVALLKTIRTTILESYAYSHLPFKIADEKHQSITRITRQQELFQIVFNLQQAQYWQPNFDNLISESCLLDTCTAKFDLSFNIIEKNKDFYLSIEYNSSLFKFNTIRSFAKSFRHLLHSIALSPQIPINQLSILDNRQLQKILVTWNATNKNYPTDKLINQLVEEQVEQTPSVPAIIMQNKTVNYTALNQRANQIAHSLIALGAMPEKYIVLYLEQSIDRIASILAVLKTGAAYVPIEPSYPKIRLQLILDDVNPILILTQNLFTNRFSTQKIPVISLDNEKFFIKQSKLNPLPKVKQTNPLSVIYTSGSTGEPKGVINLHCGALNHLQWTRDVYDLNINDKVLQKTTYMFDASFAEIFLPLISGATLVLATANDRQDIYRIIELINRYQIKLVQFVPSQLALFLDALNSNDASSLQYVWCGGEVLRNNVIKQFFKKCHAQLHNLYGTTEVSDVATHWLCNKRSVKAPIPIGKPITNVKCFVLNKYLQIVPIGVPGELYVGGAGLARGYLHKSNITDAKFIANPLKQHYGQNYDDCPLLYKTGDIVKWLPTGEIAFIGRKDHQVQIRGFRVELQEVETTLLNHPTINQAVILQHDQENANTRLIAYVVPKKTKTISQNDLILYLKKRLPYYMLPAEIVFIDNIPYMANGKLDRRALSSLSTKTRTMYLTQSITTTQKKLQKIWKSFFNKNNIQLDDDFFSLGGHSLMAAQLMIQVKKQFNVYLPLSSLFKYSTITALSKVIEDTLPLEKIPSIVEIVPAKIQQIGNPLKQQLPAFFFVHPLGGSVFCYRELAENLSVITKQNHSYQPFYAFEAQSLHTNKPIKQSISTLAKRYLKELCHIQPLGPYIIGGWSFGGLVAAEMIYQLQKNGEEDLFLILIDSSVNLARLKNLDTVNTKEILHVYQELFNITPDHKINDPKKSMIQFIEQRELHSLDYTQNEVEQIFSTICTHITALQSFCLPAINADTLLIKTEHLDKDSLSLWQQQIRKKLIVTTIKEANHWNILRQKFVNQVAKIIQTGLTRSGKVI